MFEVPGATAAGAMDQLIAKPSAESLEYVQPTWLE